VASLPRAVLLVNYAFLDLASLFPSQKRNTKLRHVVHLMALVILVSFAGKMSACLSLYQLTVPAVARARRDVEPTSFAFLESASRTSFASLIHP
jgi:hypothetical protein